MILEVHDSWSHTVGEHSPVNPAWFQVASLRGNDAFAPGVWLHMQFEWRARAFSCSSHPRSVERQTHSSTQDAWQEISSHISQSCVIQSFKCCLQRSVNTVSFLLIPRKCSLCLAQEPPSFLDLALTRNSCGTWCASNWNENWASHGSVVVNGFTVTFSLPPGLLYQHAVYAR